MSQQEITTEVEEKVDWWTVDRVAKAVPLPYCKKETIEEIYDDSGKLNVKKLSDIFMQEGRLNPDLVLKILNDAMEIFRQEPNMVPRDAPITICGDIHGQFYDLLKLFEIGGNPETTNYLFLGDYVDRGCFSCECVLLLWAYKINFPKTFTLLRGNHECKHLTDYFTFKTECIQKYNKEIYEKFLETFNTLPIAALVNKQFLCIHGGLSPEITTLEDFQDINRFQEPPSHGAFCDILWSDPIDNFGSERKDDHYIHNSVRGCAYYFTYNACCKFLEKNKLLSIIRAHEAQDTGYRMYKKNSVTGFPALITIFSAPNYLDMYNNGAAILRYENNVLNIRQFKHSPHPYWLPNFMNVFTWSIPFVGEKVMDILLSILSIASGVDDDDSVEVPIQGLTRKDIIKNKIRAVGKMSRFFGILREERESVVLLKGLTPDGTLPVGFLSGGKDTINHACKRLEDGATQEEIFAEIRKLDLINERRPPDEDTKTDDIA